MRVAMGASGGSGATGSVIGGVTAGVCASCDGGGAATGADATPGVAGMCECVCVGKESM